MRKELVLGFDIQAQPDEVTCGPTCLQALYQYYGDEHCTQSGDPRSETTENWRHPRRDVGKPRPSKRIPRAYLHL